ARVAFDACNHVCAGIAIDCRTAQKRCITELPEPVARARRAPVRIIQQDECLRATARSGCLRSHGPRSRRSRLKRAMFAALEATSRLNQARDASPTSER